MRSALYYPHTELRSESLLKTCLLMWDKLEFIVPFPEYEFRYESLNVQRAIEMIGVQRCPNDEERQKAHDQIEELATRPLPDPFFYRQEGSDAYEVYPQKLLPATWDMLRRLDLAGHPLANSDYPLTESAGLSVMSILADSCAGETRARITDRASAYATLTNLMTKSSVVAGGEEGGEGRDLHDQVVPITLKVMDAASIPLQNLIEFREREEKESGHTLRDLRHRYVDCIEAHVKSLRGAKSAADKKELDRIFESGMKDDLRRLRQELRAAGQDVILSKEILASVVAAGAMAWGVLHGLPFDLPAGYTTLGVPVTIGGIISTGTKYGAARRSIMQKHPMAYIYELAR